MLRYLGGKTRIARKIVAILAASSDKLEDPFVGGGSITIGAAKSGMSVFASDTNQDLIHFYQALQAGWRPKYVTEEDYKSLRNAPSSPQRTFAGFGCSFGGRWFGGYARSRTHKRDMVKEALDRVLREAPLLDGVAFSCGSYLDFSPRRGAVVYCDPPYLGTKGYGESFDHTRFWGWVRAVSETNKVFVSEFQAPEDFLCVWERPRRICLHHKETENTRIEKLFTLP